MVSGKYRTVRYSIREERNFARDRVSPAGDKFYAVTFRNPFYMGVPFQRGVSRKMLTAHPNIRRAEAHAKKSIREMGQIPPERKFKAVVRKLTGRRC